MSKILLVGAGHMGGALATGWVGSGVNPADIIIIDPAPGDAAKALMSMGAAHYDRPDAKNLSDIHSAVIAVKPQMFEQLAQPTAQALPEDCTVISVMAGTAMKTLDAAFAPRDIVRAMPNTPAALGQGLTAIFAPSGTAAEKLARRLLSPSGLVITVDKEVLIDVITAVSGSGPAYVFHMVEALQAAAIRAGLPEDLAGIAARQTLIGAAALLDDSENSASDLRAAVTSPNGTTQAGLEVLMSDDGLPQLMRKTVMAAFERANELGG